MWGRNEEDFFGGDLFVSHEIVIPLGMVWPLLNWVVGSMAWYWRRKKAACSSAGNSSYSVSCSTLDCTLVTTLLTHFDSIILNYWLSISTLLPS